MSENRFQWRVRLRREAAAILGKDGDDGEAAVIQLLGQDGDDYAALADGVQVKDSTQQELISKLRRADEPDYTDLDDDQ